MQNKQYMEYVHTQDIQYMELYDSSCMFAQHHRVLAIKVIPTTVIDRSILCKCAPDRLFELCSIASRFKE